MSTLDSSTVEEWMFDYHEGNLAESEKSMLLQYLEQHPEYKEEFSSWGQARITEELPQNIPFQSQLKAQNFSYGSFKGLSNAFIGGSIAGIVVCSVAGYILISTLNKIPAQPTTAPDTVKQVDVRIDPLATPGHDFPVTKSAKESVTNKGIDASATLREQEVGKTIEQDSISSIVPEQVIVPAEQKKEIKKDSVAVQRKEEVPLKNNGMRIKMKNIPLDE